MVCINTTIAIAKNVDFITPTTYNFTRFTRQYANTRVSSCCIFHTCTNKWCLSTQKWYRLTLHVRAHQGTVSIIIFKEWNHSCTNRYNFFWTNVHIVNLIWCNFQYIMTTTTSNMFSCEVPLCIKRRVCLGNCHAFFFISGHVYYAIRYAHFNNFIGILAFTIHFFYFTVWCFDEAKFVYLCIVGQGVNQANVWTFWSFNRTHTTIVRMMHVTNFETCTLTRQAARAKGRKTTFVSQFRQWVCLVHELRQLRRTKEFFDSCHYRANIDQRLRRNGFSFLNCHALTNNTFHTS